MGHFLDTVESSDVVKSINTWGKTSVETEDLVIDEGGKGEVVEEVCEVFPYVGVAILSEALVVEPVDLSNLAGFVVTTEDCDSLRVSDLEGHEEGDGFDRVVTSINIVAHEEIVGIWVRSTNSE